MTNYTIEHIQWGMKEKDFGKIDVIFLRTPRHFITEETIFTL